ncbi:Gamma-tubulin complex component 4 [Dinochytrium kinnereticum]|nr:Gamma-tubulin complex component 4 [Dinochytrium kinnereticum]
MLHELLAMLAGFADLTAPTGDLFIPHPPPPSPPTSLIIRPDFPYLHASERASINRIAHIAYLHTRVITLLHELVPDVSEASEKGAYVYLRSFGDGVDVVLEDYRGRIVEVERKALTPHDADTRGGKVPLSFLVQSFGKYERILPHLLDLLTSIQSNRDTHHGLRLISAIHTRAIKSGSAELKTMWTFLLGHLNQVLAKQIGTWITFGILADPGKEFFVVGPPELDPWLAMEDYGPVEVGRMKAGGGEVEGDKWQWEFKLDETLIPSYMSHQTAEDILFVGKAMHAISKSEKFSFDLIDGMARENLLLMEPLTDVSQFSTLALEVVFQKVRKAMSRSLWNIVVVGMDASDPYGFTVSLGGLPVRLELDVKWPVSLILSPENLASYTRLFSFLITIKSCQLRLQRIWTLTSTAGALGRDGGGSLRDMDVIEAQHHLMMRATSLSPLTPDTTPDPDFESLLTSHAQLLTACLKGCFLEPPSDDAQPPTQEGSRKGLRIVERTLRDILGACGRFCAGVERREGVGEGVGVEVGEVEEAEKEFTTNVAFLFRSLKSIRESPRRSLPPLLIEHLDALLLRLDHNLFYSRNAGIGGRGFGLGGGGLVV